MSNLNESQVLQLLQVEGIGQLEKVILPAITVQIMLNPSITDAQLLSTEDGSMKHFARKKIGFFVDFVWPFIEPTVDSAITAAIPQARAAATPPLGDPKPLAPFTIPNALTAATGGVLMNSANPTTGQESAL